MYRRIRDLREDLDLTQTDVARLLHCSQRVYSNYERGDVDIPTSVLIQLARFHGTSVDYLLGLTDEKAPYPPGRSTEGE
jgi:transcriptional regulator with XRE-family HTH domain